MRVAWCVLALGLCAGAAQTRGPQSEASRPPGAARVTLAADAPPYVARAAVELDRQIRQSGKVRFVETVLTNADGLGEEGYDSEFADGAMRITARSWRGINYGLLEAVKVLSAARGNAALSAELNRREIPRFGVRAMYAHTAWVYNRPFALRSWDEADWKRYVDLLAYMKVNVLQIWNLISIMPQPLGRADEAYLRMFREIVRYAIEERGFRAVWLGDAANNVALPSAAPLKDREYYVVHSLKDPGDPKQLTEIINSREPLYRLVPNANGYWVIDSDPGNWPGSPSEEFVKLLAENRKMITAHAERKRDAELIYWIWHGWGTKTKAEDLKTILGGLENVDNYALLACFPDDLRFVADSGLIAKTTWFPYGAIEGEPSSPYTALRFGEIRKGFDATSGYPELRGVMGNAQTPLVQLPNLWLFHSAAWDAAYGRKSDAEILRDLAEQIYPRHAATIAEGWQALGESDSRAAKAAARRLEIALKGKTLGAPGALGRHVARDSRWALTNLAAQLRQHAVAVDLVQSLHRNAPVGEVSGLAQRYFDAAADMQTATGFRPAVNKKGENLLPFFNWFYPNRDFAAIRSAWDTYVKARPNEAEQIRRDLKRHSQTADKRASAAEMVEFLVGNPPRRAPDFKYAN